MPVDFQQDVIQAPELEETEREKGNKTNAPTREDLNKLTHNADRERQKTDRKETDRKPTSNQITAEQTLKSKENPKARMEKNKPDKEKDLSTKEFKIMIHKREKDRKKTDKQKKDVTEPSLDKRNEKTNEKQKKIESTDKNIICGENCSLSVKVPKGVSADHEEALNPTTQPTKVRTAKDVLHSILEATKKVAKHNEKTDQEQKQKESILNNIICDEYCSLSVKVPQGVSADHEEVSHLTTSSTTTKEITLTEETSDLELPTMVPVSEVKEDVLSKKKYAKKLALITKEFESIDESNEIQRQKEQSVKNKVDKPTCSSKEVQKETLLQNEKELKKQKKKKNK